MNDLIKMSKSFSEPHLSAFVSDVRRIKLFAKWQLNSPLFVVFSSIVFSNIIKYSSVFFARQTVKAVSL